MQVDVANVYLDNVKKYRAAKPCLSIMKLIKRKPYLIITLDNFTLFGSANFNIETVSSTLIPNRYFGEKEIAFVPACWLLDYL